MSTYGEDYAVRVPVGTPTVAPPRLPPILVPGSLVPVQLAARWRRAVAGVVDATPFLLAALGLAVLIQGPRVGSALWPGVFTKKVDTRSLGLPDISPTQPVPASQLQALMVFSAVMLAVYGLWTAYRVILLSRYGRTGGKWLMGIAVVDARDPRRNPSVGQAFRRGLVPQGAGLVPLPLTGFLPYLWIFRDARNQGLHDRAAGTLVVSRPR